MNNHRSRAWSFAGISWLFLASAMPGGAQSVAIPCAADNTLYEDGAGSLSGGLDSYFLVGMTGAEIGGDEFRIVRGVLKFNVSSYIPSGSTITSAVLRLNLSADSATSQSLSLYRLQKSWGEGASGGNVGGSPSTAGSATWIHTYYSTSSWSNAGGDYAPVDSAQVTATGPGVYTFESATLRSDVRTWFTYPASNHGWMVKGDESYGASMFDSREHPTAGNRPVLIVGFSNNIPPSLTIRRSGRTDLNCSWEAIIGSLYRLEYSTNLTGSQVWTSLGDYTPTNLAASVTDTNSTRYRMYRVVRP